MAGKLIRPIIIVGAFSALSVGGGLLKIPSPVGSIAFDSAPGYFVAALYGPFLGAAVGAIGHIGSAATGGMPLGYVHFAIMAVMAVWCGLFGFIAQRSKSIWSLVVAGLVAIGGNGAATPFLLASWGLIPLQLAQGIVWILIAASALNVLVAAVAAWSLTKFRKGA